MAKKPTLKHLLDNGTVATRQSARPYTHVVVAQHNIEREVARILSYDTAEAKARRERDARESYAHAVQVMQAGVGGRADYVRGQGGYGMREGFAVDKWHVDHETEWFHKRGGSLENFIKYEHEGFAESQASSIKRARERGSEWFVLSWHHSRALADKAAAAAELYNTRVEAVNNGVR
jgi:hypothetical protein